MVKASEGPGPGSSPRHSWLHGAPGSPKSRWCGHNCGPQPLGAAPDGVRLEVCTPGLKVPPAEGSAAQKSSPPPGEGLAVPSENASRVLPRALWKTLPASAADMASEFLASPEYTAWEGTTRRHTATPRGRSWLARGGALSSRRGRRGSTARGAASAAWAGWPLERALWDRLGRLAGGGPWSGTRLGLEPLCLGLGWGTSLA